MHSRVISPISVSYVVVARLGRARHRNIILNGWKIVVGVAHYLLVKNNVMEQLFPLLLSTLTTKSCKVYRHIVALPKEITSLSEL